MQVWLNGALCPAEAARVSPFDRGFLFGEGVYEAVRIFDGVGVGMPEHVARLERSLAALSIRGVDPDLLEEASAALLAANGLADAVIYLQATRGGIVGRRSHLPDGDPPPTLFGFAVAAPPLGELRAPGEVAATLRPDERWGRCDLKTTNLLGNVLALEHARRQGAAEALLHAEGWLTEGAYSNLFAVIDGRIATPPLAGARPILAGVTRGMLLETLREAGDSVVEAPIRIESLRQASEIFITSSSRLLSAVTAVDGRAVGPGGAGPVARRAFDLLRARIGRDLRAVAAQRGTPLETSP